MDSDEDMESDHYTIKMVIELPNDQLVIAAAGNDQRLTIVEKNHITRIL